MEMTQMVLGMAQRYREAGMAHPVAAAVSVAARGVTGLERGPFAEGHDIDEELVEECETGRVPFAALPDVVGALVEGSRRISLLQLADFDREVRRQEGQAESFRRAVFSWAFDQPVDESVESPVDGAVIDELAERRRDAGTLRRVWATPPRSDRAAHRMIHELLYSEPSEMG